MRVKAVIWARGSLFGMVAFRPAVLPPGRLHLDDLRDIAARGEKNFRWGWSKSLPYSVAAPGRPDNRGMFRYLLVLSSTVDPPVFFWSMQSRPCTDFFCL
jgi:hypothetical protein